MRKVIHYVFCTLCMDCSGRAVSGNRQDCNRQSMQLVQNAWLLGNGLCLNAWTMDTNEVFQTAIFLILFIRNNERSPGIDGKTRKCLSGIFYITVILSTIPLVTVV